jgi:alpha-D-ribose 1-methylphosphonate 5-triphosphate synthase subunit PhnG
MHQPPYDALDQGEYHSILSRSPAAAVKQFAETIIPLLGPIQVLQNRTGLAMAPMRDTGQGRAFYMGGALIAEAHVRLGKTEGYGACLGCDLEHALAIALLDAALVAGMARNRIHTFIQEQAAAQAEADPPLITGGGCTRRGSGHMSNGPLFHPGQVVLKCFPPLDTPPRNQ